MPSVSAMRPCYQVLLVTLIAELGIFCLTDFKKELEIHVAESYGKVEKSLYDVYEENSATITEKLEELFAIVDRIGNISKISLMYNNNLQENLKLNWKDLCPT